MSKSEKMHISAMFLQITFSWGIFYNVFQQIWNQREILRFLTPILNFWIKFLFALISTFCKLWMQMRTKRLKERKTFVNIVKMVVPYWPSTIRFKFTIARSTGAYIRSQRNSPDSLQPKSMIILTGRRERHRER